MKRYVLLAALGAALVAGCATNNTKTAATDDDEKVTVTGSRIPRGDRNAPGLKGTSDKNSITDMMRPAGGGGMPGS